MKQNEKFLKESVDLLSREFGEPLPTLKSVMEKHQQVNENPAAMAAAQSTVIKNPKTGRKNKLSTALGDKSHPQHKKAKGVFSKLVDKFKKKKKSEPKKGGMSKADAMKQAGIYRSGKELKEATQKQEIQTEFGRFRIEHGETETGPGYDRQYFLEVSLNNQYLGHFIIEGDPQKKGSVAKVTTKLGKKQVRLK